MSDTQGVVSLSPEQLQHYIDTHQESEYELIDVRQPMEYRQGHLPGARLLPLARVEESLADMQPKRDIVFYCRSGHRSLMAAKFAAASGRVKTPVRHLAGGIMGWNGHALPESPRVDAFRDAQNLHDRLLRALEMEKGAWLLYNHIKDKSQRPILCELMGRLLEMEKRHAMVVYDELAAHEQDMPDFQTLFDSLEGDILESGQRIDDLTPWIDSALSGDCLDIAELALEVEYGAYDLYRAMAGQSSTEHEQSSFLSLAEQEKWHARTILDALDQMLEDDGKGA